MLTVLYICKGNVLRSPAAELITNQELQRRGLDGLVKAESAGLYSMADHDSGWKREYHPLWKSMARNVRALGYDTSMHKPPRPASLALLESAAVTLCMEAHQVKIVEHSLSKQGLPVDGRVISTIHQFAGHGEKDLVDPYIFSFRFGYRGAYRQAATEIRQCVLDIIPKLEELAHNPKVRR